MKGELSLKLLSISSTGVSVSPQDAEMAVKSYMDKNSAMMEEQKWAALSSVMTAMRADPALRWANPLDIKNAVEKSLEASYGPKGKQAPPTKSVKEPKASTKVREGMRKVNMTTVLMFDAPCRQKQRLQRLIRTLCSGTASFPSCTNLVETYSERLYSKTNTCERLEAV